MIHFGVSLARSMGAVLGIQSSSVGAVLGDIMNILNGPMIGDTTFLPGHSPISLQQGMSLVLNQCTNTVCGRISVAHSVFLVVVASVQIFRHLQSIVGDLSHCRYIL